MEQHQAITNSEPSAQQAAMYVRMSTEHQKYSIDNQTITIQLYAKKIGVNIVEKYADEGISGLTYEKRDALKRLIETVLNGKATFKHILVYDVSRWGRFQDIDESAHYEYLCRKMGMTVHYVAEQFDNDNTPIAAVLKTIKRIIAAEYSRELSAKISATKRIQVSKGIFIGGKPGYGLRRALVGDDGKIKQILNPTEQKALRSGTTILIPGPREETQTVKFIFETFVHGTLTRTEIASLLKANNAGKDSPIAWHPNDVIRILENEKYIGNIITNKYSLKLGERKQVTNPPDKWIRTIGAWEPIVSKELFMMAQKKLQRLRYSRNKQEMLDGLKKQLKKTGYLSISSINLDPNIPPISAYKRRFGNVTKIYKLLGYQPVCKKIRAQSYSCCAAINRSVEDKLIKIFRNSNIDVKKVDTGKPSPRFWQVQGKLIFSVVICRRLRWINRHDLYQYWGFLGLRRCRIDMVVAVCLNKKNNRPEKLYLLPSSFAQSSQYIRFPKAKEMEIEKYRYKNISEISKAILKHTKKSRESFHSRQSSSQNQSLGSHGANLCANLS